MIKYLTSLCFLFFLSNCSSKRCVVDKEFVKDYERRLQVIEMQERKDSVNVDDYRNALMYFYKITGFLPRADYSSTIGYRDRLVYEEDVKKLKTWLKNNKCTYTKKTCDSILRSSGYSNLVSQRK